MRNWLRLPPPLRLAIPALVLVFNLCFVAVTAWFIISRDRGREIDRIQYQAQQQVAALASAASRLAPDSTENRNGFLQEAISFADAEDDVILAAVISRDRRVLYSTRAKQAELLEAIVDPQALPIIDRVLAGSRAQQIVINDRSVVAVHSITS